MPKQLRVRQLAIGLLIAGLLASCRPTRPAPPDPPVDATTLVAQWLASFDSRSPEAYAAPLAVDFSYDGRVIGSDVRPWTLDRDLDVSAMRRAFEKGYFDSWRARVLHRAGAEVVAEIRFRYATIYDKTRPDWSVQCEVVTRLMLTLDPTGRSIVRVREVLPPGRHGGPHATLAWVKRLNLEPDSVRTSTRIMPGGEVRDDAYTTDDGGVAFTVRSISRDARSPTGMLVGETSAQVLDARGRRVLDCASAE